MKAQTIIITLLAFILVACTPAVTLVPTEMSPPTTLTPTAKVIATVTPSPMPARPTFAVITPDAVQVERWREYQSALANSFSFSLSELALCEWDILGQTNQEVYVWAVCENLGGSSVSAPAVIHLGANGSIQNVENPKHWNSDIPRMFPTEIQEKFDYYRFGRANELLAHIAWRRMHPDEPPLMPAATLEVAPSITTPSPMPTLPVITFITPDAVQVAKWKEYEQALARSLLPGSPLELFFGDWVILVGCDREVCGGVSCASPGSEARIPAVIHLENDGSIQDVEVPSNGSKWDSDIHRMFPADVREKFDFFFSSISIELGKHLVFREKHPEVPPLIILLATPMP